MDNEKLNLLAEAAEIIQDGVDKAYEALGGEDIYDIGLGFADTTADNIREFVCKSRRIYEWLSNPKPVSGYLLEFYNEEKEKWIPSEFCIINMTTNIWSSSLLKKEFLDHAIQVGFYPELGDSVWAEDFDDWDFRLGIYEDITQETPSGYVGGLTFGDGDLYRVSKLTISGVMSETAKAFFMAHPEATWNID